MDALILSCSTGGGHNAAGRAIYEELILRGHNATMLDPYTLVGGNVDKKVGGSYVKLVQVAPRAFGCVYKLGDMYRKMPIHSPVYWANKAMLKPLSEYLEKNHFDVIFFPHIYPGEMLTYMKKKGISVPKTIFVSTDYACIPFTEEIDFDYAIIPGDELADEYVSFGIDRSKILPLGIPTSRPFSEPFDRDALLESLGLNKNKRYLLLTGGSMGSGRIEREIELILTNTDDTLIAVCGGNPSLYEKLKGKYSGNDRLVLLGKTNRMADYMRISDIFIGKPGGLSSTEAGACGIPFIQISPIPGCETKNMKYFSERGMSIALGFDIESLPKAIKTLKIKENAEKMVSAQKKYINPYSAKQICEFAENVCK